MGTRQSNRLVSPTAASGLPAASGLSLPCAVLPGGRSARPCARDPPAAMSPASAPLPRRPAVARHAHLAKAANGERRCGQHRLFRTPDSQMLAPVTASYVTRRSSRCLPLDPACLARPDNWDG